MWYKSSSNTLVHDITNNITLHHITHDIGWLPNYTNTRIYNIGSNRHTLWPFTCFSDSANVVYKYINIAKKTETHNIILRGTIIEVWICNICETFHIQHQGCQLRSKFLITWITSSSKKNYNTMQSQFFELLATVHNKAHCYPI